MNKISTNSVFVWLFLFVAVLGSPFFALAQERQETEIDFPDGTLWRAQDDYRVFVISNGMKRHIPSPEVFYSYGFKMNDVKIADSEILFEIPDVRVVKVPDKDSVYDITTGKRRLIPSAEEFLDDEFSWDEISIINNTELESYPIFEKNSSDQYFTAAQTPPSQIYQSLLLKKISEAKNLLRDTPPVYPQTKKISAAGSLSMGDNGSQIKELQLKLQELGYFPKSVYANGNFGPATDKAVRAFQRAKGISAVGIVGPKTQAALSKYGLFFGVKTISQWQDVVPEDREVLLAVWNETSNKIEPVRILLDTQRIKVGNTYRAVLKAISKTPEFNVQYKSGSGVNVQYAVISPTGWQVLANRFPIFDAGSGQYGTFPPSEEIYVPYSDSLKTPKVVASGREYLDSVVSEALGELRKKGVQSVSGRGLVADLMDPDELKNIALIEHIDQTEFSKTDDKQGVINKVFTILGTNRENAYKFSGSSKGALGLAQFISGTYSGIRKDYPRANLIVDFNEGMANHVNAFQAMSLYHDISGATLESYVVNLLAKNPIDVAFALAEVRAAAYNGGAGRVKLALQKFGQQWDSAMGGLRAETKDYLTKFRIVRQILKSS